MALYDASPDFALTSSVFIFNNDSIDGLMNLSNNDRFLILHDEYINNQNTQNLSLAGHFFVNLRKTPLDCIWDDNGSGSITHLSKGAIFLLGCVIADGSVTNTTVTYSARLRYVDV